MENVLIKNFHPDSENFPTCNCESSHFKDKYHGHIVTNNLDVIECNDLRALLKKGPKYREPQNVNWDYFLTHFKTNLKICLQNWIVNTEIELKSLDVFYNKVLKNIITAIEKIKKRKRFYRKMRLSIPKIKELLSTLQENFVFVPTDKAGNNIAIVCKVFYISKAIEELGIYQNIKAKEQKERTYIEINDSFKRIIDRHVKYSTSKLNCDSIPDKLPYLYWIPKMHKKQISKQQYIAASGFCTTKPISQMLTKASKRIDTQLQYLSTRFSQKYGINQYWIISKSTDVFKCSSHFNFKLNCRNIRTYDFQLFIQRFHTYF